MQIKTDRLILRDLKITDFENIQINANNPNIAKWLSPIPYPYTLKDAKLFVKRCIKNTKTRPRRSYDFGIALKEDNKIIGMISITEIDLFHEYATIGYWLGEKYWHKGYAYEALKAIIVFAFTKVKLRRINITVSEKNKSSNKLIKKIGFTYEGTRVKFMKDKITGKIQNDRIYRMLKNEWKF